MLLESSQKLDCSHFWHSKVTSRTGQSKISAAEPIVESVVFFRVAAVSITNGPIQHKAKGPSERSSDSSRTWKARTEQRTAASQWQQNGFSFRASAFGGQLLPKQEAVTTRAVTTKAKSLSIQPDGSQAVLPTKESLFRNQPDHSDMPRLLLEFSELRCH